MDRTFAGGCHCRAVTYAVELEDCTPLNETYCHCDDCRLTSGAYCSLFVDIPRAALRIQGAAALREYRSSEKATRTFCARCGTSLMYSPVRAPDVVGLPAATVIAPEGGLRGLVRPARHIFLGSTAEGGIANIIDDGLPRFTGSVDTAECNPPAAPSLSARLANYVEGEWGDELHGACHCGAVSFSIARPPADYMRDPVLQNWVKVGRRVAGTHCFCDDCRMGTPLWSLAFVPLKLITWAPGAEAAMQVCCGCQIAFELTPEVWDIPAAILEQPKAEGWVAWRPNPPGEDPADKVLGRRLEMWLRAEMSVSFPTDGERYHPELLAEVVRGLSKSVRF